MSLTKEDLTKAKEIWEKIIKQAEIDTGQSQLYLACINKELEKLENAPHN